MPDGRPTDPLDAIRATPPEDLGPPAMGGAPPAPPEDPPSGRDDPPHATAVDFDCNDLGNGRRLALHYGADMHFAYRMGWFVWDGKVWRMDDDAVKVRGFAHRLPDLIRGEADHLPQDPAWAEAEARLASAQEAVGQFGEDDKSEPAKAARSALADAIKIARAARRARKGLLGSREEFARASGDSSKMSNALREAQALLSVPIEEMNADPLTVGAQNGVVRLEQAPAAHGRPIWRARLDPHRREDLITKSVAADYHPRTFRPVFDKLLARIQPDPEIRAFLKRWFGYSLTGSTEEQKLLFLYGQGRNGKSTLVDALAYVFADYQATMPIESLTGDAQRKGSDATPDLVRLPGARMVRASEPEQGQKMREALIKQLTGGEAILVRRMQQEFMEIVPTFKLTIQGNHRPEIRGGDDGIWRRVILVPFDVQIPPEEVDRSLGRKLRAEADGIFAWLVEGALEWLSVGLQEPEAVRQATNAYRADSQPFRSFLLEQCRITGDPDHFTLTREVVAAYQAWQRRAEGVDHWQAGTIQRKLKALADGGLRNADGVGFKSHKRNGIQGYLGLTLGPRALQALSDDGGYVR